MLESTLSDPTIISTVNFNSEKRIIYKNDDHEDEWVHSKKIIME